MLSEIVDRYSRESTHGRAVDHPKTRRRSARHGVPGIHRRGIGPRDDHRQRRCTIHDGRPRHDLVRLRHRRHRCRLRARAHLRLPHQPRRHPRAGRHRQVPVVTGTCLRRRAGRRCDHRRWRHPRRARHRRPRRRPRGRHLFGNRQPGTGLLRRIRGYVHSRVHRLRRDTPQGDRRLRRRRHRPRRVRRDHPGRTHHRRLDQPGPHVRPDARPTDRRRLRVVESAAGLRGRRTARRCARRLRLRRDLPHQRRRRTTPGPPDPAAQTTAA